VLDPVYYAVSAVMWLWHQLFSLALGPASGTSWALSVVFLVLTLRAVMIKPFLAQVRSARGLQAIAPQLSQLRKRYRNDPVRLAEKTRALQARHGVSTFGAILPALVQAPVFLALLHVLNHFNRPGLSFAENAAIPNYAFPAADVRSFLQARLFGSPLSAYLSMPQQALDSFGAHVQRLDVVLAAVPLLVLAAVATFLSMRRSLRAQPVGAVNSAGAVAAVSRALPWVLPLGLVAGGVLFPFPVAILLYWLTSNVWTLVQQHLVYRALDRARTAVPVRAAVAAPRPGAKPVRRGRDRT
jgi:YidC/Oxa1 family membrane protein insertase